MSNKKKIDKLKHIVFEQEKENEILRNRLMDDNYNENINELFVTIICENIRMLKREQAIRKLIADYEASHDPMCPAGFFIMELEALMNDRGDE